MAFTYSSKDQLYFNQSKGVTRAYTCASGTKLLILGFVIATATPRIGSAPTYNGVTMTQVGSVLITSKCTVEYWYLVNPDTGSSYNLIVPYSGSKAGRLYISSYLSTYTPELDVFDTYNLTSQNPTITLNTSTDGEVIIDIIGHDYGLTESGRNQTLLYANDDGLYNSAAQYAIQSSAGDITFTHNEVSSDVTGMIVAAFKELNPTHQETILSDAHIKAIDIQKTITSDAVIYSSIKKNIYSDAHIKATDIQETILSDAKIVIRNQKTIFSNAHIKAIGIAKTILSDASIAIQVLYDITTKINFTKQALYDINNKFSLVKRIFSDINCYINTTKSLIYDVNNKINTQVRKLYDVNNDIRFIKSWQKPGSFGFQSLGKEYIKVFIATVEQTDINIDSINIHKMINQAHTASFDLGRTYDNVTVPALEAVVEIRYYQFDLINYWILYKGYVTSVVPSDTPESITVNCQDEYWKQNQTNKYFFVGHNPYDNREKYYNTIKIALLTELGWTLDIGDFVPEIIDCFGQGQSDITSSLIEQCGNFGWWYDIDGTRKLWEGGRGTQINIQRQAIGTNINIFQLLEHKITTTSENVINRYRIQMGQKTGRSSQGGRQYEVYVCSNFEGFATPAWDRSLERLAKKRGLNGYGFNYTGPDTSGDFADVFKKFYIQDLDPDTSGWSDRYPAKVEVFNPGGGWGNMYGFSLGEITEGFTIDYENRIITFNEPVYIFKYNSYGEVDAVRAPIVKVSLWKENYYTYTASESEDAGSAVSNPYMFFRDATGFVPAPTYLTTITKFLNLTGLTHQEGITYIDYKGVSHTVRGFDDTDYAKDYTDWQLSNTCDAKINGTFTLTLDALCFYNIDLSKRIYISGITDTPLNITSIDYNISNFTVSIEVGNKRYYKRTVSLPRHD
jgi:hypothetical protein